MLDLNAKAGLFTLAPFLGTPLGQLVMRRNNKEEFRALRRPWFSPPEWAFPVAWTALYASMGYASYLVYRDTNSELFSDQLVLYGSQLALNWTFTPVFFGLKRRGWGTVICGSLWALVGVTMRAFYNVNENAGLLLLPYQIWLTLATAVSYQVWKLNKDKNE